MSRIDSPRSTVQLPKMSARESFDLVARRLCLNEPRTTLRALRILKKIVSNALTHQGEAKFRSIPSHNATVRTKLLEVIGGREGLKACGFLPKTRDCELFYEFRLDTPPPRDAETESERTVAAAEASYLTAAQTWLDREIEKLESISAKREVVAVAVDARVVCRLPGGQSVELGFHRNETVRDVRNFIARHLLSNITTTRVTLTTALASQRYTESGSIADEGRMDTTLESAGFVPKVVLFVAVEPDPDSVRTAREDDSAVPGNTHKQQHRDIAARRRVEEEKRRALRLEKKRAAQAVKTNRERTLKDFRAQRDTMKELADRKRLNAVMLTVTADVATADAVTDDGASAAATVAGK